LTLYAGGGGGSMHLLITVYVFYFDF
jgi:hypothetical protein